MLHVLQLQVCAHMLVKSKYIVSLTLATGLHQSHYLCCLHFSFLLGFVGNIHHCCFCISVHCETTKTGREKEKRKHE